MAAVGSFAFPGVRPMPEPHPLPNDRAANARRVHLINAAHRAADDPVALARATRIVRAALARRALDLSALTPLPPCDVRGGVA